MSDRCQHATHSPTKENPGGDCGRPASRAVALGQTGRWLPVCEQDAPRYLVTIPLDQVPEL